MKAFFLPLAVATSLTACSGPTETRVTSSGQTGAAPHNYVIDASGVAATADLMLAQKLVGEGLAARGFSAADNAPLNLEITLSSRPASLAVTGDAGKVIAPAKRRKSFQSCTDVEYRLGVILTQISDGSEIYRASAAEYHCKVTLAETLPYLVSAALADLGQPAGPHVLKRKAPE